MVLLFFIYLDPITLLNDQFIYGIEPELVPADRRAPIPSFLELWSVSVRSTQSLDIYGVPGQLAVDVMAGWQLHRPGPALKPDRAHLDRRAPT